MSLFVFHILLKLNVAGYPIKPRVCSQKQNWKRNKCFISITVSNTVITGESSKKMCPCLAKNTNNEFLLTILKTICSFSLQPEKQFIHLGSHFCCSINLLFYFAKCVSVNFSVFLCKMCISTVPPYFNIDSIYKENISTSISLAIVL